MSDMGMVSGAKQSEFASVVFASKVAKITDDIKHMLIEKNRAYGNSALEPVRIFSSASPLEQIKVRIDDKLSRIKNNPTAFGEDVVSDLIGYLILLKIKESEK